MAFKPATNAVGALHSNRVGPTVARAVAKTVKRLTDDGFKARADPAGKPWQERVDTRRHPILQLTKKLRKGLSAKAEGATVKLTPNVDYAHFHQFGTKKMVARPMAPRGKLPPVWAKAIDATVRVALDGLVSGSTKKRKRRPRAPK